LNATKKFRALPNLKSLVRTGTICETPAHSARHCSKNIPDQTLFRNPISGNCFTFHNRGQTFLIYLYASESALSVRFGRMRAIEQTLRFLTSLYVGAPKLLHP
jgi:hypothetical protein